MNSVTSRQPTATVSTSLAADEPTLTELRDRFRRGDDTPLSAVTRALARIDEHNGELHAFLAVDRERALAEAEAATLAWRSSRRHPPLLGIPISVKDTIEVEGMPTTYGSRLFTHNNQADSVVAQRLRAQGAIIIGKTNTPEFSLVSEVRNQLTPPGRNPLDLTRTCGGSSGGAAASVVAGMSVAALGTDSAGSIRIPAAYQGLVGLKPSYQRIPWVQEWKASLTRSHTGPITRSVADAWALLEALSGYHWRDPASRLPALEHNEFQNGAEHELRTLRVACLLDADGTEDPDTSHLVDDLRHLLIDVFDRVEELTWESVTPPAQPQEPEATWPYAGEHVSAALFLRPDLVDHLDELSDHARPIYTDGLTQPAHEYLAAASRERQRGLQLGDALSPYDYVFSAVAPEAPPLVEDYVPLRFPRLALLNLAGLPAVSIPFGAYPSGMPRAIQIVGRFGDDAGVLSVAACLSRLM